MSGFAEGTPTKDIQLGGKSYTLGWTWGARRRARVALTDRYPDPKNVDKSEAIAAALWASMDKETREAVSVEDIEEMIHPGNEIEIMQKIDELIKASEPDPEPEGNAQPAAGKKPTAGSKKSRTGSQRSRSATSG